MATDFSSKAQAPTGHNSAVRLRRDPAVLSHYLIHGDSALRGEVSACFLHPTCYQLPFCPPQAHPRAHSLESLLPHPVTFKIKSLLARANSQCLPTSHAFLTPQSHPTLISISSSSKILLLPRTSALSWGSSALVGTSKRGGCLLCRDSRERDL